MIMSIIGAIVLIVIIIGVFGFLGKKGFESDAKHYNDYYTDDTKLQEGEESPEMEWEEIKPRKGNKEK